MKKRLLSAVFFCIFLFSLLFSLSITGCANEALEVIEADIIIKPGYFRSMSDSNNRKSKYPALVSIDGSDYSLVSVNTRGNSSFWDGVFSDSGRMPFEIRFDAYANNDSYPMSNLKLNNHASLYKLLSEYTAYKIYEYMGIPTPFVTPVFLTFNSVDFGLYLGVEDINDDFIENHFGEEALKTGTLYRSVTDDSDFSTDNIIQSPWFGTLYVKHGDNHEALISLTDALTRGKDFEKYLDTDLLIRYFACIACTCDFDSLAGYNNFYMFSHNGKISFIPWDPSQAFHGFSGQEGIFDMSALFNAVIGNEENEKKYISCIEDIRNKFLAPDKSSSWVKNLKSTVESYMLRDRSIAFPVDIMLENIDDGNILVDGNLALSMSELYRQTGEQISGKRDSFYIPDFAKGNIRDAYPPEELYVGNLDAVKYEVCQRFSSKIYYGTILSPSRIILLISLAMPVIAILVYLIFTTVKQKKSSKNKSSGEIC